MENDHYTSSREMVSSEGLIRFSVRQQESNLIVLCRRHLREEAEAALMIARSIIERYIFKVPEFRSCFTPMLVDPNASPLIISMMNAASRTGVGPMAAVAGAIAEFVGEQLLSLAREVIVQNGRDIYIASIGSRIVRVYSDSPQFKDYIKIKIPEGFSPIGVCTSSGGRSRALNYGNTDAVTVLSKSTALADAAATAISNRITSEDEITYGLSFARSIDGLLGVLVIMGTKMRVWGSIEIA